MDRALIPFERFSWLSALLDLFYPRVCEVCGSVLVRGESYLCTSCLADFPFVDEDFATDGSVLDNFNENFRPEALHALFYYSKYSDYKKLVYSVKYHSNRKLGVYLGRMLGQKIARFCQADCVVPIPLHPKRERERGFNQAREIARGVCEVLGVELLDNVVERLRNNVSQTGKNAAERLENVSGIFELRHPELVRGRHILLLDDVITTGATVGACLEALAEAGDVRFSLACLARTV